MHANRVRAARDDERHGGERLERNRPRRWVFGEAGCACGHEYEFFLGERQQINFFSGLRVVEHRDVEPPVDESVLQNRRQRFADRDRGVGHLRTKLPRERHRQHPRQTRRQPYRHAPRQRATHTSQLLARALHLMQDATAVLQQKLARLGRRCAAPIAHE